MEDKDNKVYDSFSNTAKIVISREMKAIVTFAVQ